MKILKQLLAPFVLSVIFAGIVHAHSVVQTRAQSYIFIPCTKLIQTQEAFALQGLFENKCVSNKEAQEMLYDAFFKHVKVHAIADSARGRNKVVVCAKRRKENAQHDAWVPWDMEALQRSIKQLLMMFAFSATCAHFAYGMEHRPMATNRIYSHNFVLQSTRNSSYANNRQYEKVSCFPCCVKKEKPLSPEEKLARNTALLIKAVQKSDTRTVMGYLYHGDELNRKDEYGLTALHYAARNLNVAVARYLLSTPRIDLTVTSPQGLTALRIVQLQQEDARGEVLERCNQFIQLIRKREAQEEVESRYIYTMDIGDRYPVEDKEGNLWTIVQGRVVKCGAIGPRVEREEMEACVFEN